jgi:hypothetical protein
MHAEAQSGEAAHAAYKGGLAAGQARRLQSFLETAAVQPAALPARLWDSSEAAAAELFRHAPACVSLPHVLSMTGQQPSE